MSLHSTVANSASLDDADDASDHSMNNEAITALVKRAQHHMRRARARAFATQLRLSWFQCCASLFSLVLVCTDIPRSGLGINRYLAKTTKLEPDVFQFYGPWHYPMQSTTAASANETQARLWGYKFDTTSIGLRAFAKRYELTSFPPCVVYKQSCPNETLPGATVFAMIDSLVDAAVAAKSGTQARIHARAHARVDPTRVTLRSENTYLDRFHHYIFPELFATPIRRTNQLLHYPPELLASASSGARADRENARRLCFGFAARPSFCQELWMNFALSCGKASESDCKQVGRAVDHAMQRVHTVQQLYPALPVDVTFIESFDDVQSCRCGICLSGVRKADVTVITRARQCDGASCRTIFLDEFRYETGVVQSHVMQWYHVVASLRVVGQGYYYVRIALLLLFCFTLISDDDSSNDDAVVRLFDSADPVPQTTLRARLGKACVLFLKTPMQTVIFSASFPIVCYTCAHAIDASVTYEMLANIFTTPNGVFEVAFRDLCFVGFNQMRSVWLFAIALRTSISTQSFSHRGLSWQPIDGVRGVPEFFLGAMASITMAAQLRSNRFRNTRVRSVYEVAETPTMLAIKYQHGTTYHRGAGIVPLGGVLIDFKFLLCIVALLGTVLTVRNVHFKLSSDRRVLRHTKSPVSYAAGVLWPVSAMCVHWSTDYYCVKPPPLLLSVPGTRDARGADTIIRRESRTPCAPRKVHPWGLASTIKNLPSVVMNRRSFHTIQSQMAVLHERDDDVDASIAFMNLVMLSDPFVYYMMLKGGRAGTGKLLGYYRSARKPSKVFLLPCEVVVASNTHTCDLVLLCRTRSSALHFADLVHCG